MYSMVLKYLVSAVKASAMEAEFILELTLSRLACRKGMVRRNVILNFLYKLKTPVKEVNMCVPMI